MKKANKLFLILSAVAAVLLIAGVVMQNASLYKPFAIATAVFLAIGLGSVQSLKGYQYTAWIIAAVVAGMFFPEAFKNWGGVNLRDKTLILVIIQLVMFGMGTHMSLKDFSGLASTGKGVLVGGAGVNEGASVGVLAGGRFIDGKLAAGSSAGTGLLNNNMIVKMAIPETTINPTTNPQTQPGMPVRTTTTG